MNNEIKPFLFLRIFVKELFHKRQYVSLRRLKVAILMWQIPVADSKESATFECIMFIND